MPEKDLVEELDLELIKSRSIKGVTSLISRSVVVQIISTVGFFLLTVFLGRSDIGIFFAVTEIVAILGYFSDIGLAASLVQKREAPSKTDLRTTFTIQQSLVLTSILLVLAASPLIRNFYNLSNTALLLLYALLAGFFLASLKTIPSILLERSLRFEKLAVVEVVEAVVFYATAVFLASKGYGVGSYTLAILFRGIIGTILLYKFNPWPIGFAYSKDSLRSLLKFGVPYQLNTFLAVIKDRFTNLLLFKIVGADGLGILGWATTWSQKPLRFIMDNVTKVTFPALSRLQDQPAHLARALEKSLFYSCSVIFPVLAGFALVARPVILIIPNYQKWEIAILPLYLFLFSAAWAAVSTPFTQALNAIGKIKYTFYLMIIWTAITLLLIPFMAYKFGFMGVAYATAIIALTSIIPVIITKKFIKFSLTKSILEPVINTTIMVIPVLLIIKFFTGPVSVFVAAVLGVLVYISSVRIVSGKEVFKLT